MKLTDEEIKQIVREEIRAKVQELFDNKGIRRMLEEPLTKRKRKKIKEKFKRISRKLEKEAKSNRDNYLRTGKKPVV